MLETKVTSLLVTSKGKSVSTRSEKAALEKLVVRGGKMQLSFKWKYWCTLSESLSMKPVMHCTHN